MSKKKCCVLTPKPSTPFLIHKTLSPSTAMRLAGEAILPNTSVQCNYFVLREIKEKVLELAWVLQK